MNKKIALLWLYLLFFILFVGCFALPTEPPLLAPPVLTVAETRPFSTVAVGRGDVQMSANPVARYLPIRAEQTYFEEDGFPILGIFVSIGDEVEEGDIIAALDIPEIQEELDELIRQRKRLEMELSQLEERLALELNLAERFNQPVDVQSFRTARDDLIYNLGLLGRRLEYAEQREEQRYLRAPMSGTITHAATFADGMQSRSTQNIATVTDRAVSAFTVRSREAEFMSPGDRFEMTVGAETFLMEVADPYDFGLVRDNAFLREAILVFVDAPPFLTAGVHGRVNIVFDVVKDALYIPVTSLRRVGERVFVYVLGDDGIRAIRDVTIGMESVNIVEITSGLSEGELVIR